MLAKFSKSSLLNVQKRVLTRTFIATPAVKYENDRPSFNSYVSVSLGYHLVYNPTLRVLYAFNCIDEQDMSVLAPTMANRTWERVVPIKPEATTISVMSVINVEVVSVTLERGARADTNPADSKCVPNSGPFY